MAERNKMINSKIEWTNNTWNPIRGCSRVSEGCRNCYAEKIAGRFSGKGNAYEGLATLHHVRRPNGETETTEARWTGKIAFIEKHLLDPLKLKKPSRIFVNSMSDLFHEGVTPEMHGDIFNVMARAPQHIYQILTKRPKEMLSVMKTGAELDLAKKFMGEFKQPWPPSNWWFGVSVEDQKTAEERIPLLLQTPAAVRWVSYEPALGPVDFTEWTCADVATSPSSLDWIVCGGESGTGARPMHPDWARSVRDQCVEAGVPFFFKQWGDNVPICAASVEQVQKHADIEAFREMPMYRVGKKNAGRLLDGREWNEYPSEAKHGD